MKFSLMASAAAIAMAGTAAQAGGYIAPVVETAPIVEVQQPMAWSGGYVGVTLGYGFMGDDEVGIGQGQVRTLTTPDELEPNGANGGLRVGFRNQFEGEKRDWVIGGELGYEVGNIGDEFSTDGYKAEVEVNNVIALRVKTGVLNANKDTLFYGISGIAQADFDYMVNGNGAGGPVAINAEGETSTGYILGLGVEKMLNERMSLTGEWEYANFGETSLEDAAGKSTEATPDYHNLKIGLNFHF